MICKKILKKSKKLIYFCTKNDNILGNTINYFILFLQNHILIVDMKIKTISSNIFRFYYDGFRSMTIGKKLWTIILIKLFVMFVIFKLFFFPNFLKSHFKTNEEKSQYIIEQLIQ
jgi:hypothetical protein